MKTWHLDKHLLIEVTKMTFTFQVICLGKVNTWLVRIIFSLTRRDLLKEKSIVHQIHAHTHLKTEVIIKEKISELQMENGIDN